MTLLKNQTQIEFLSSYNFKGSIQNGWIEKSYNAYLRYTYMKSDLSLMAYINLTKNIRNDAITVDIQNLGETSLTKEDF
jgi:hypothetical protein